MKRRAIVLANLKSGSARRFAEATRDLGAAGIQISGIYLDLDCAAIVSAVDDALQKGIDHVIIFGGDGTVGAVMDALAERNVTIGVLPAGTSNNFARSLGISMTLAEAVREIAAGEAQSISLGKINGRHFAHAAIIGLNVSFAEKVERYRPFIGRLSYPLVSLLVYRSRRTFKVWVEADGIQYSSDTFQFTILSPAVPVGPRPALGDKPCNGNQLQAQSLDEMSLATVVRDLPAIFFRRHLGLPGAAVFELSRGRMTTAGPLDITLDGEIKTTTPAEFSVVRAAFRVIVPPAREADS